MSTRRTKQLSIGLCCLFLMILTACGGSGGGSTQGASANKNATGNGGIAAVDTTPTTPRLGVQPCPTAVSDAVYWNPIVSAQEGVDAVASVTCASLTNTDALQALVVVRYEGVGQNANIYVFTNITGPNPTQIFKLAKLYKGDAKISAYNTLLTAEVDQGSSVNATLTGAGYKQDLFREFKWSSGIGTLVPVSFPGIFPHLTRYEAESEQQQVSQGKAQALNATQIAGKLAATLLKWPNDAATTTVSGGNQHDRDAVVAVKNNGKTITVALSRLGGNTNNGIWEATSVTSDGTVITAPQGRDILNGTPTVTGNIAGDTTGKVKILDHLYTTIGTADVKGGTLFSATISYTASFKGGTQEGLVILYSYGADGAVVGAVMLKELLNNA